jgi:hypothetical protein
MLTMLRISPNALRHCGWVDRFARGPKPSNDEGRPVMNRATLKLTTVALALALPPWAGPGWAGMIAINFETPPFPTTAQPDNFAAAGAMQTYTQPGVFSISGGVVLGNPTFLSEFPGNGSPPNLYGTTDIADPSLLSTITLSLDASQGITSVKGLLFNGQNSVASGTTESYTVTAFSGSNTVDVHNFSLSIDLTSASSFAAFSLSSTNAAPITQVTFTTPDAGINGWDFLVDSIVAQSAAAVPEPSSIVMVGTALLPGLAYGWRRRKQA